MKTANETAFSAELKRRLVLSGRTYRSVAAEAGLSSASVSEMATGKIIGKRDTARRLCAALGATGSDLDYMDGLWLEARANAAAPRKSDSELLVEILAELQKITALIESAKIRRSGIVGAQEADKEIAEMLSQIATRGRKPA